MTLQPSATLFLRLCQALCLFTVAFTAADAIQAQTPPADGQLQFAELGNCKLDNGQQITDCRLGYRTWGKLNAESSNAILLPTWFSGTSEQLGGNVGADKLVDPAKYFVVTIDAFANGISSSPSNSKTQPRLSFPAITTRDMVRAEYRLATETLHLKHAHAIMGISMGGMQTFQWMVDYPDFMDIAIPIVGSTRLTAYDLLLWQGEEDAIRATPAWNNGNYDKTPPMEQVAILHDMNLTTPSHYAREVTLPSFPQRFADYKTSGATEMDANDRIYQLEAMIHHDIANGGSLEEAAKKVKARVLIVYSEQDHMVNPGPAEAFAKLLNARTIALTSDCGHLAPSCEAEKLNPQVRAFLDEAK